MGIFSPQLLRQFFSDLPLWRRIILTYSNSQWGDLLTAFNGNTITYDGVGNPLQYYNGNVFTWEQGRRLGTITKNGAFVASYDYDENGIRTSKTTADTAYKYILNGSQIVAELWDDCINIYLYDEYGSPIGFLHRYKNMAEDTYKTYFYEKNMFGDILAIYDQNGVKQVSYTYDAFGKSTRTIHVANTRAMYNSFRYRGYYYDNETGLYYLNRRSLWFITTMMKTSCTNKIKYDKIKEPRRSKRGWYLTNPCNRLIKAPLVYHIMLP